MLYPEFRDAEYSITDIPPRSRAKHFLTTFIKGFAFITIFTAVSVVFCLFFNAILVRSTEDGRINAISVGASIVTVISAIVAVLSLLDADCMKKYDDDLRLLEKRYLNGRGITGWNFLHRNSFFYGDKHHINNYYISSACYKLYSGTGFAHSIDIIVPALSVDFKDIPCLLQIWRIRRFIPGYLRYINNEQQCFKADDTQKIQPVFFLPLPYHIISLYQRILMHKILRSTIAISSLSIISAILVTVIWLIL